MMGFFQILKFTFLLAMTAKRHFAHASNNDPNRRCYEPYGCFDNTGPWDALVFAPPESPSQINTSFKLYNKDKPNGAVLHNTNPVTSDITSGDEIVVLIHGISTSGGHDESMYITMRPDLLAKTNAQNQKYLNVITVDYTGAMHATSSPFSDIRQNLGNARLVAEQIYYLLKKLKVAGKLACNDVHIIGFSLGASIAGIVGKRLKADNCMIPRITGLDPVLSQFSATYSSLGDATKLHRSDATYVDVIHTHTQYDDRIGHADFYPNGGSSQSGCSSTHCHHFRAVELLTDTILPAGDCCEATKCGTNERFNENRCESNPRRKMGFGSNKADASNGKYFLTTEGTTPYCGCSSGGGKNKLH